MAYVIVICRRFFTAFFLLLLLSGMANADQPAPDASPFSHVVTTNPQVNPFLNGWGNLGLIFGLDKEAIRLGGLFAPQFNWTASGGVRPHSTFGGLVLTYNLGVDSQKTLGIPGGTFGIEMLEYTGGATNHAAGSVQQYDGLNGPPPRFRHLELLQLWWHQRLFNDKLIFQIGKMNAAGSFGAVLSPVAISNPKLQDTDISVLTWALSGINPTMFGRIPIYPNTAYGAAVHLAPVKNFYASYGIFDGGAAMGKQTGMMYEPRITPYKFQVGELGATWLLGEENKPGRFGIGGWVQTGDLFTPYLTHQNGAQGFYMYANQRLWYRNPDRDNSGLVTFLQFGRTNDHAAMVNTYFGGGLTAIGMAPVLPNNRISVGIAYSKLNDAPFAGVFFFPGVPSHSLKLRADELMFQIALQTTYVIPMPKGFWAANIPLTTAASYTYIPTPGERLDLPAAHLVTTRLVVMF